MGFWLLTRSFNFYPRPPRGGRLPDVLPVWCRLQISIHALREEGDQCNLQKYQ